jgi:hypothetical protein
MKEPGFAFFIAIQVPNRGSQTGNRLSVRNSLLERLFSCAVEENGRTLPLKREVTYHLMS